MTSVRQSIKGILKSTSPSAQGRECIEPRMLYSTAMLTAHGRALQNLAQAYTKILRMLSPTVFSPLTGPEEVMTARNEKSEDQGKAASLGKSLRHRSALKSCSRYSGDVGPFPCCNGMYIVANVLLHHEIRLLVQSESLLLRGT